jgi:glycosyltransferase involved in cell wall biosynthesis
VKDPWDQRESIRDELGCQGRTTIMTFGLLGPNKGIEYALRALPRVVESHPDVLYLIVGATHPGELDRSAEGYRTSLEELVEELGLGEHVRFEARYLPDEELRRWLSATDIYLLPFVEPEQVSSGTLGWAMGWGRAVISTDFRYARELLSEGDGRLVPVRDSSAIAVELLRLLEDRQQLTILGRRAHEASRLTRWEDIGGRYHRLFSAVRSELSESPSRSLENLARGWQ